MNKEKTLNDSRPETGSLFSFHEKAHPWVKYASMLLIVLVTYATLKNVLWNGFVNYDDNVYIYENESIIIAKS